MDWIKEYQLFLLDFDGLLVNTERLHYGAYLRMCKARGFELTWNFEDFCRAAHFDSKMLRVKMQESLPELFEQEPNWSVLYTEKKKHYLDILKETKIELMPGVEEFLYALKQENLKRVVVTHSPREQVDFIRSTNEALNTIEHWITREDYNLSKPHPEPYLKAIEKFSSPGDQMIGFEDSPRGINSLMGTSAKPVLISPIVAEKLQLLVKEHKVFHFTSLNEITKEKLSK